MIIKAKLNTDIRRITISDKEFSQLVYTRFCEIISTPFQLNPEKVIVKYKDEEGDIISINSDLEFSEAKKLINAVDPTIFRVQVFIKEEKVGNDAIQDFVELVVPFLKSDKFRHIVRKGFVRAYEKRYSTHTQEGRHHSAPCCQEEHPPTRLVPNEVALPENKQPLLSPLQPQLQSQEKILENEKQCHFEQEKEDENDPPQEEQLQVFVIISLLLKML